MHLANFAQMGENKASVILTGFLKGGAGAAPAQGHPQLLLFACEGGASGEESVR